MSTQCRSGRRWAAGGDTALCTGRIIVDRLSRCATLRAGHGGRHDGVDLILGGYASVAVEFKDHLAIVESGQSETRGEAVIAEAKRLVPNKPIRYIEGFIFAYLPRSAS